MTVPPGQDDRSVRRVRLAQAYFQKAFCLMNVIAASGRQRTNPRAGFVLKKVAARTCRPSPIGLAGTSFVLRLPSVRQLSVKRHLRTRRVN